MFKILLIQNNEMFFDITIKTLFVSSATLFLGYELSGVNCTYAPKISLNKTYKLKPLSGILIAFGSIAVKGLSDNILKTIK